MTLESVQKDFLQIKIYRWMKIIIQARSGVTNACQVKY